MCHQLTERNKRVNVGVDELLSISMWNSAAPRKRLNSNSDLQVATSEEKGTRQGTLTRESGRQTDVGQERRLGPSAAGSASGEDESLKRSSLGEESWNVYLSRQARHRSLFMEVELLFDRSEYLLPFRSKCPCRRIKVQTVWKPIAWIGSRKARREISLAR